MTRIALHYNPNCNACARQATRTLRLDWFGRVEATTEDSPLGKVPAGNIVVVDKRSGKALEGLSATRKVCMQIPLYFPLGLLLHLLPTRAIAKNVQRECDGNACDT